MGSFCFGKTKTRASERVSFVLRKKVKEVGKHATGVGILNAAELSKQFNKLEKNAEKAVNSTVRDFKSRAPGWVSQAIREKYNIKAQEIKPLTKAGKEKGVKSAGRIRVEGETLETVTLTYKGRVLTPIHFGLLPKAPKTTYKLTAKVKDGMRKRLGGRKALTKRQKKNIGRNFTRQGERHTRREPIILIHTGNTREGGVDHIPMRIKKNGRLEAIKTISLPQMVDNEDVRQTINATIEEEMSKRLKYNVERFVK